MFASILSVAVGGCAGPGTDDAARARKSILAMKNETLSELYRERPEARSAIRSAAGYAVFSNVNAHVLLISAGDGYGVLIDNGANRSTFMRMATAGVGPGIGARDYRAVIVFGDKDSLDRFRDSGWGFGASADALLQFNGAGGGVGTAGDADSGTQVYTLTKGGVALQAGIAGTKYWKYDELN
jgi:lipid-binding SYLF domain-containing protein